MANLPTSKVGLKDTGGAIATGTANLIVAAPVLSGPLFTPRFCTSVAAVLALFGPGEMSEFCGHYIELTQQPVTVIGLTPIAGSLSQVDATLVTGTGVPTVAGTPNDDAQVQVQIIAAGVLGAAGPQFQYSLDNGQVWSRTQRLGTNLTFTIPNTGIVITFGTGTQTYVVGDFFIFRSYAPTFDGTDLTSLEAALAGSATLSRLVMTLGDMSASVCQSASDMMDDYETVRHRDTRLVGSLRPLYQAAKKTGAATLTFATPANTVTRSTGSWITDGFQIGMRVSFSGSVSNNLVAAQITGLSATVMTLASTLTIVAEAATANVIATAIENEGDWMAALDAITLGKIWNRLVLGGGRLMRTSPIDGFRRARNVSWATVCRYMSHDLQASPARVSDGRLEGWSLYDANNALVHHDERVNGGLLQSRITCARSFDTDPGGAYVALALTLAADDTPLSRLPVACLGDLTCTLCNSLTTTKLNGNYQLNDDGTLLESEARRIETSINSQLKAQLLTPGVEGPRASDVLYTLTRGIDLRQPGAKQTWACKLTALGYIEQFDGTVIVQGATS